MKKYIISLIVFIFIINLTSTTAAGVRKIGASISCYTCNSRNRTDENCHDPFNPAMSKYIESCKVPKQNHIGVFPARFCVKVIGKTASEGVELVIRACSLENMDNQCGSFRFEKDHLQGCILTCDYDGCNRSTKLFRMSTNCLFNIVIIIITIITMIS